MARGGCAQLSQPAKVRARAHHVARYLHHVELEIASREKVCDGATVYVVGLAFASALTAQGESLQAHAVGSERVRLEASINLIARAIARDSADDVAHAAKRRSRLQDVRSL